VNLEFALSSSEKIKVYECVKEWKIIGFPFNLRIFKDEPCDAINDTKSLNNSQLFLVKLQFETSISLILGA